MKLLRSVVGWLPETASFQREFSVHITIRTAVLTLIAGSVAVISEEGRLKSHRR
ncbi:MAG TPA: hypothetical protein VKV57_16385 [bacterium]|nr:hypothetical protein [bacterium]